MRAHLPLVAVVLIASTAVLAANEDEPPLAQADFYVSPAGDDTDPGTFARPFATIERARDAVRVLIAQVPVAEVRVCLRGGVYALDRTLELGPQDSGTPAHGVTYARYIPARRCASWERSNSRPIGSPR